MHLYTSNATFTPWFLESLVVRESVHVALFMHGDERHSLMSTSQWNPMYPAGQTQPYANTASTHVEPFRHGYDEHSLMSISQCSPVHPLAHVHEYCTTHAAFVHAPSLHVAPFMHGFDEHS